MSARITAKSAVHGAQSIRRAIAILRILAVGQEHGVRLTDIVEESGLSRPTAHRILRVLLEEGTVEQDAQTRKYLIGQEVSLLALARTARTPVRAVAEPYLHHIAEKTGDTVFLTIRSGFDSICVDRRTGNYPVKVLSIEIGARRPLGVGVGGLVLLAFLPRAESAAITRANAQRLAHHGLGTAKLNERVRVTRSKGYAYTEVGVVRGTKALAVPVFAPDGEAVAAISIAAISDRITTARTATLVSLMTQQAALVSRRLAELARAGK
jgi:DNA-binding IclR family transcriptional regulator